MAVALRLISINQSLWLDEATTALAAKMPLTDLFIKFLPGDFHPPFYYLLMHFWIKIFGYSEISLRIPSVIFGVATIYVVYLISKKLFDKKTGLISAILLATSGLSIYYSQEARMYSLAAFLVGLLVFLFLENKWVWFSITLALLGITDYASLLILPVFWFFGFRKKKFILANLPLVGVFLAWLPIFSRQLLTGLSVKSVSPLWWKVLGTVSIKNMALIPVKFILGRISFDNKDVYAIVFGLSFLLFAYLVLKVVRSAKILWFWLLLPIFFGVLLSFEIPTLTYFRFLFCLPPFYILVSNGLRRLGTNQLRTLFTLILLINIGSSGYYLFNPKFQRENWRGAAKMIGGDEIVVPADSQKEALIYYGKGNQIVDAVNFSGGPKEIWLSRYVWEIADPTDSARNKIEILGYNKVAEYNFNGVIFWKYKKI